MKLTFGITFGTLLLAIAAALILSAAGLFPAWVIPIFVSWQALILAAGIKMLLMRQYPFGAAVTCTAVYFMVPHIYRVLEIPMPFEKGTLNTLLVAAVLVVAGIATLKFGGNWKLPNKHMFEVKPDKKGVPQIASVFGQTNHAIIEKPFRGATTSTAFGETRLNLSRTSLPEGDSYLEVNNAFGTTRIVTPPSWHIQLSAQSFFGEVKDLRTEKPSTGDRRLIIRGANAFGTIEIESAAVIPADEEEEEVSAEKLETISVKHNNRVYIIPLDELLYIQADGDYVTLCTAQGNFLKEQTMKYFQQALPSERFVRIHRSYIVNLAEIASLDCRGKETYYVVLKNGTSLRTSVSGYQELKQKLEI